MRRKRREALGRKGSKAVVEESKAKQVAKVKPMMKKKVKEIYLSSDSASSSSDSPGPCRPLLRVTSLPPGGGVPGERKEDLND